MAKLGNPKSMIPPLKFPRGIKNWQLLNCLLSKPSIGCWNWTLYFMVLVIMNSWPLQSLPSSLTWPLVDGSHLLQLLVYFPEPEAELGQFWWIHWATFTPHPGWVGESSQVAFPCMISSWQCPNHPCKVHVLGCKEGLPLTASRISLSQQNFHFFDKSPVLLSSGLVVWMVYRPVSQIIP